MCLYNGNKAYLLGINELINFCYTCNEETVRYHPRWGVIECVILLNFLVTVKAALHECVISTGLL